MLLALQRPSRVLARPVLPENIRQSTFHDMFGFGLMSEDGVARKSTTRACNPNMLFGSKPGITAISQSVLCIFVEHTLVSRTLPNRTAVRFTRFDRSLFIGLVRSVRGQTVPKSVRKRFRSEGCQKAPSPSAISGKFPLPKDVLS